MKTEPELPKKDQRVEAAKKPYSPPQLIVHGTIEKLTQGAGPPSTDAALAAFSAPSDRNLKEGFACVDPSDILSRAAALPIESWSYKAQGQAVRHIGPMAQDFHAAFNVGENNRFINLIDANGVALASIQALYKMIEERDARVEALRAEIEELKQFVRQT
jgi:hypothetical protein